MFLPLDPPLPKRAAEFVLFCLNMYGRCYSVTRKHCSLAALCVASRQFATFTHGTNDDPAGQIRSDGTGQVTPMRQSCARL